MLLAIVLGLPTLNVLLVWFTRGWLRLFFALLPLVLVLGTVAVDARILSQGGAPPILFTCFSLPVAFAVLAGGGVAHLLSRRADVAGPHGAATDAITDRPPPSPPPSGRSPG